MTDKPGRKPSVPKTERVIELIIAGEYDGVLGEIRSAIDKRNEARKAAVMEIVHEVFGNDAVVTTGADSSPNPFIRKANEGQAKARVHQAPLPGPYRADPIGGNSMRAAGPPDADGMITVTDIFGGHETYMQLSDWEKWQKLESDDEDPITLDALAGMDDQERKMIIESGDDRMPGRGGAIIAGLGSGDMGI